MQNDSEFLRSLGIGSSDLGSSADNVRIMHVPMSGSSDNVWIESPPEGLVVERRIPALGEIVLVRHLGEMWSVGRLVKITSRTWHLKSLVEKTGCAGFVSHFTFHNTECFGVVTNTDAVLRWYWRATPGGITQPEAEETASFLCSWQGDDEVVFRFNQPLMLLNRGEVVPVLEAHPPAVRKGDVVLFVKVMNNMEHKSQRIVCGVGEVKLCSRRGFRPSVLVGLRPSPTLRKSIGADQIRLTRKGDDNFWFEAPGRSRLTSSRTDTSLQFWISRTSNLLTPPRTDRRPRG